MPHANNFMLHIMLAVAEQEREMISSRTKQALAAARERGQQLGGGNGSAMLKDRAAAFAESLRTILEPLRHLSLREIAAHLNAGGIKSVTGGVWTAGTVTRVIDRLNLQGAAA
jgi:DNA invertase Pin-like site-specific DNA recombinase